MSLPAPLFRPCIGQVLQCRLPDWHTGVECLGLEKSVCWHTGVKCLGLEKSVCWHTGVKCLGLEKIVSVDILV